MGGDGNRLEGFDALAAEAEAALSSGYWATAASAYENLIRSDRAPLAFRYKLAQAYEELGRMDEAVALLSDPLIAHQEKAKRRLAKILIAGKSFKAARPLVDELLSAYPTDPKLLKWKTLCEKKGGSDHRIASTIEKGEKLLEAERLGEAEEVYLNLLADHPHVVRAYLHLGQIYVQQKRWADAVRPLKAGAAIDPGNAKIKTSLARALFKLGELAEAAALLDSSRNAKSDVNDLYLLQRCLAGLGDWPGVAELGGRLLSRLQREDPLRPAVSALGRDAAMQMDAARIDVIAAAGDTHGAISGYREITRSYPDWSSGWLKLGTSLLDAGHAEEAVDELRRARDLHPGDMEIRRALTRAMIASRDEEQVLRYVQDAINSGLGDFDGYRWLTRYHADRAEWGSSLEHAQEALALDPSHPSVRMAAVRALIQLGRFPEALDGLDSLVSTGAKHAEALQVKADIFVRLGRPGEAIELYREALEAAPKHPLISYRLGCASLMNGDIEGFNRFFEKRRQLPDFPENKRAVAFQDWRGELEIEGKLLVWTEPGFDVGQNILHMRFLNALEGLGLNLVLEVDQSLVDLCRRSFPRLTVVSDHDSLPAGISHHTPVGSLSRWFKPDLASLGSQQPYLVPDGNAFAKQRDRLQGEAGEGQVLVGIDWDSSAPIPLQEVLGAVDILGVRLVDLRNAHAGYGIAGTGKHLLDSRVAAGDLDGLAALVAALDLVVCADSPAAHIAGAVGTPAFVLLPPVAAPHWLAEGEQCIWYPVHRLFRQSSLDQDWQAVLTRPAEAVRAFALGWNPKTRGADAPVDASGPSSASPGTLAAPELRDAISAFIAQGAFAPGAYRSALELIGRLPPEHVSRAVQEQRGELLTRFGRWDEARAVYVALRPVEGADPEIDRKILSNSLAMYDLESALALARGLAEEDSAYRLTAAQILYHLRRHEEALAELRALSMAAPQTEGLGTLTGRVLLEMGAFARAEAYLADQAAVTRRADDYALLGQSLSAQGRHEEALAALEKGVALSRYHPAANFWRTQERIGLGLVTRVPLPPLLGEVPRAVPEDVVIFFAADSRFFWEHGLVLIGSAARSSPQAKCHVHVINPDPGIGPAIETIRSILPGLDLSYSYEHVDFEGCSDVHIRTYYASVRFVRLAEVYARAPAHYLCVDADGIVRGDVTAPVRAAQPGAAACDIGIYLRFDDRPHMAVLASASLWRPTPGAAKFVEEVGTLIRSTLEAREAIWFLDQIVLNHVLREFGNSQTAVSPLDITYLDWFFQDESLIWTGKGPRKFEDDTYTGELAGFRYLQDYERISQLMPEQREVAEQEGGHRVAESS